MASERGRNRTAKLIRIGRRRALPIPADFATTADEVSLQRQGHRLLVDERPRASLLAYLANLDPIEDDFAPVDDAPPSPVG
ncbi:MAG: AbrB/MazE/SpoVT family DNA-binding domain-containing protein [Alphaproteobacteria bacterium]|nr:AbrB/MazE/SpoVT family DNA-binding domain-containing protein [Alphaproteobacteria bacterium]